MRRPKAVDPRDQEIENLNRQLSNARQYIIELSPAPDELKELLSFETTFDHKTHDDYRRWEQEVIAAVIERAVPDPKLSDRYEDRAACPLCGSIGSNKGFKLPLGLSYHLEGTLSALHCRVTEAAFEDARKGRIERERREKN